MEQNKTQSEHVWTVWYRNELVSDNEAHQRPVVKHIIQ